MRDGLRVTLAADDSEFWGLNMGSYQWRIVGKCV